MIITAEVSLYPLKDKYEDAVWQYISYLEAYPALEVKAGGMSTLVTGEYDEVMMALSEVTRRSFDQEPSAIILFKIANSDRREA